MNNFKEEYVKTRKEVIARNFPHLNDKQREAVLTTEGPLLVLAGAGSGKTTVLINRILNLLKYGRASDCDELPPDADEQKLQTMKDYLAGDDSLKYEAETAAMYCPVKPWQILAITFTNKAADEMKSRLRAQLKSDYAEQVWARTFHSACVRILRKHADRLDYPQSFTIYDRGDCETMIKRIVKEQNRDEKKFPPREVLSVIDKARDKLMTPDMLLQAAERMGDLKNVQIAEIYREYSRRLKADGAMDFEDLIYLTVRLFREHEDVLQEYRRQFRYVLIDEYQDTNNLQYLLASLLAGEHKNICVVGDDDQSIYSFRGAKVENILSFRERYENAREIKLEQNYRSTGHILNAANGVIANNAGRMGKNLWTRGSRGEPVVLHVAQNDLDEAQFIVRETMQAVRRGAKLSDHAVLYRTNAQSRPIEQAFLRNGIKPRIVKGNAFFERAEIKDVMAYFFLLLNPADELRLVRIINTPARGIGAATVERVQMLAAQVNAPMFTVMAMAEQFPELGRAKEKLTAFTAMIGELYTIAAQNDLESLFDALMEKTGYMQMLREKKTDENQNRIENVQELKSFIVTHVQQTGDNTLAGFLDEVSLYTDLQGMDESEDTVSLMTIHSAKGLEFDTVFLSGMEEGIFPGLGAIGIPEEMQEERRLAYVGITRAKNRLFLTAARQRMQYGKTTAHKVSRFVDEIPDDDIERPVADFRRPQQSSWFDFDDVAQPDFDFDFDDEPRYAPPRPARVTQFAQPRRERPPVRPKEEYRSAVTAPKKKPAAKPAQQLPDIRPGDRVKHNAFGEGVVKSLQPMGGDALVEISFPSAGTKRLMLKAAMRYMQKI